MQHKNHHKNTPHTGFYWARERESKTCLFLSFRFLLLKYIERQQAS